MADTQWPRYEVFIQDRLGRPHRNVGSVHAVDPEMALQNARDVFVRRPQTTSIWVVPEAEILSVSRQEFNEFYRENKSSDEEQDREQIYLVFQKVSQRPSMTYVVHSGEVEARSSLEALKKAAGQFNETETFIWWILPKRAVFESSDGDVDSLFTQAQYKKYRMPQEYRLTLEMIEIKRGDGDDDEQ